MSRWVADETNSDIYRVTPKEAYDTNYEGCADRVKNEVDNGIRPELDNLLDGETVSQYDVIYVGFPIWRGTMPMCIFTLLEKFDLSGKNIIPFCTNEGSGMGSSERDMKKLCPGAAIKSGLVFRYTAQKRRLRKTRCLHG